ncbi:thioredoxin domain-containing protein [Coxiella-like endosymbiont]|uniref:thioredoxin domain-containing protein n=1 Tax=Coxiella-like endosymbiont TaxID=1592897 RepID=UPI002729D294|nr:thioredoxin domain-containing protein [Coxiella-like endosymbiont]
MSPSKILNFEDLKYFNCAWFSNELLPIIKKKYIDKGIAKYSLITLAFLLGSILAGNVALYLYEQNENYFFPFYSIFINIS